MLVDSHVSWEQKLPREEVHLDLPPLSAAVVDNAVHPNGRRLRGADWVNVGWELSLFLAITQLCVPDLVRHQERLVECRPLFLMEDQGNVWVKGGPPPVEQRAVGSAALNPDAKVFGDGDSEVIRDPRIAPSL
jgi:hypothetical protein